MWNRKHSKIQLRTLGLKYGQFHTAHGNRLVIPEHFLNSAEADRMSEMGQSGKVQTEQMFQVCASSRRRRLPGHRSYSEKPAACEGQNAWFPHPQFSVAELPNYLPQVVRVLFEDAARFPDASASTTARPCLNALLRVKASCLNEDNQKKPLQEGSLPFL